ncbi:MAG TPA: hypothetical protein VN224_08325, partial [Xanthomonadales bacterium]|nr:hypothetical protein [Xanthomonadales bacterium]
MADLDDRWMRTDTVHRVSTARIIFADHDLLQHDFPPLAKLSRERQEHWLLEHAGIISSAQAAESTVNTHIETAGEPRPAWRPSRYGRAVIVPAHEHAPGTGAQCGLLDIKGAGIAADRVPSLHFHSSGLCYVREVLREALFASLIDTIFRRAAPAFHTVPIYGIIDLGFDARRRTGPPLPAGALVRRAHRREPNGELPRRGSTIERTKLEIELLLRHYGITSSNRGTRFQFEREGERIRVRYAGGAYADPDTTQQRLIAERLGAAPLPLTCDGVNVQLTRDLNTSPEFRAQLVDFGHYEMRTGFEYPLVSLVRDDFIRWGAAIWPSDPAFVQPLPSLCVPENLWGSIRGRSSEVEEHGRSGNDRPSILAEELSQSFRAGTITGEAVRT